MGAVSRFCSCCQVTQHEVTCTSVSNTGFFMSPTLPVNSCNDFDYLSAAILQEEFLFSSVPSKLRIVGMYKPYCLSHFENGGQVLSCRLLRGSGCQCQAWWRGLKVAPDHSNPTQVCFNQQYSAYSWVYLSHRTVERTSCLLVEPWMLSTDSPSAANLHPAATAAASSFLIRPVSCSGRMDESLVNRLRLPGESVT